MKEEEQFGASSMSCPSTMYTSTSHGMVVTYYDILCDGDMVWNKSFLFI